MKCFSPALRDDVVFNAIGRCPIAGHYEGKRVYSEEVLAKLHDRLLVRPTLVVDKIIVDGEVAMSDQNSFMGLMISNRPSCLDDVWPTEAGFCLREQPFSGFAYFWRMLRFQKLNVDADKFLRNSVQFALGFHFPL